MTGLLSCVTRGCRGEGMTRLPCMAVKQPWADLLVRGIKDVENRNSAMHSNLVGQWCAIYASMTLATVGQWIHAYHSYSSLSDPASFWPWTPNHRIARKQCTRGAIVGLVRWSHSYAPYCGLLPTTPWRDRTMHGWTYSDRIVLPEPVPLPDGGKQSLYWYLDVKTDAMVLQSVGRLSDIVGCDM